MAVKLAAVLAMVVAAQSISLAMAQTSTALGSGTKSCGAWTEDRRTPDTHAAFQDMQWVLGFLSGVGFMGQGEIDPLNGLDAHAVWAWIDNYCRDHPLSRISGATAAFKNAHPR